MRVTAPKEFWSGVLAAVGDLTEGSAALLAAGPEGLRLATLDPSSVLFAEARLPRHLFADFEAAGEEALAVDLGKLKNFVAAGRKGSAWEFSIAKDERGPVLFLKSGSLSFTTRPAPPESVRTVKGLAIEFKATLEAPAEPLRDLLRTLRKCAKQAELAALRVREGAASIRVLDGEMEPLADISLGPGEAMARGEAGTWLSTELLTPALSKLLALKPSELRAELADRGPARFTALLDSGGEVSVLMAPREPPEPEGPVPAEEAEAAEEPEEGPRAEAEEPDLPPDEPDESPEAGEDAEEIHAVEAAPVVPEVPATRPPGVPTGRGSAPTLHLRIALLPTGEFGAYAPEGDRWRYSPHPLLAALLAALEAVGRRGAPRIPAPPESVLGDGFCSLRAGGE